MANALSSTAVESLHRAATGRTVSKEEMDTLKAGDRRLDELIRGIKGWQQEISLKKSAGESFY